ncbi:elongation factor 4 [Candidatus Wolfebacteria bacterium RIFCSPLOWO2_01_FULL_45_19]|uniref:Elongation factor 4 n=1 Tax=Candidatus Wolfebacteria bacterium RIFCSPLOWO2_01_FULL_45_19 TaxID=1802557 RepID=A0A1F8DSS6_9BACT|nr:MAG: elongation factor 4 [Candidatus Wolfebacteria bacterium RIFCSPLOWO2_01_FULL_45_19]
MNNIRNFCIIAHIDHGKSTLADRFLEVTGTVEKRKMRAQYLDQLELERERGITIKMAPVRMSYLLNHKSYILNLIDTPGHSDFSYEVSRGLAAVEGAILLVDATQGLQAQTLSNFNAARKIGLKIIGAVNKVDLEPPQLEETVRNLAALLEVPLSDIFRVSAKTGYGVERLLNAVIDRVPSPLEEPSDVFKALVFNSLYDDHKGVVSFVRVFSGKIASGNEIFLMASNTRSKLKEVGYFAPELKKGEMLNEGEIGYLATGIKDPDTLKIGDTIASDQVKPLPGYKEPKPVLFVSFYPEDNNEYENLKQALRRLRLNDPALTFEPDSNELLGRGFKCGFLGRLHFEITAERLEREFNLKTINSFPSVTYEVVEKNKTSIITSPEDFPNKPDAIKEPVAEVEILAPSKYLSAILGLKEKFRFQDIKTEIVGSLNVIKVIMPLADLMLDFDDNIKTLSAGFASFSYELKEMQPADVVKLEIIVAGQRVPGLSRIVPKKDIIREGRVMTEKLKKILPRQQISQTVQAIAGGQIIAREDIPALRKDVAGYLYGGDRTRKMKLWQKQKRGKKKMAAMTKIVIPPKAYLELLKKQ